MRDGREKSRRKRKLEERLGEEREEVERQKRGNDDRNKEGRGRKAEKIASAWLQDRLCFWAAACSGLAEADNDFPGGNPG